MINFEKNSYDVSIFRDLLTESFLKECMNSADDKEYSIQNDWRDKLDNPCFDDTIDIADDKNIMKFDKKFADTLLSKVKEINDRHQEKYNKMITDLPKFESNFEMLHKKFYDV